MPKAFSWKNRLPEIREEIAHSNKECWERGDIGTTFKLESTAAKKLMRTIGDVQRIGPFVLREKILRFLDKTDEAVDLYSTVRSLQAEARPVPVRKPLRINLDDDSSVVTADQLPANVILEPGRLEITGASAQEIYRGLAMLARAVEFDPMGVDGRLDPLPVPPEVEDDDLKALFTDLRAREAAKAKPL